MNCNARQRGFSMLEIMIVVALLLIISAMAVPSIMQTIESYRIDASTHSVASLVQQARILAVKTNQPNYVQFDTTKTPNMVFISNNPTATYANGMPDVAAGNHISFQSTGIPDYSQLTAYLGGASVQPELGTAIGFNARGLPCMANNSSGTLCQAQDPTKPGSTTAYLWFVQDSANGGWGAITVTPGGRVKTWRLEFTDSSSTKTHCGYPACWG
jgi:prepilin-type N-terminal cleavage/methylation domain-containing protein